MAPKKDSLDNQNSPVDIISQDTVRFAWPDITEKLWNQNLPYQLVVAEVNGESVGVYKGMEYTLPANPESLSISAPFAITAAATLDGIVETHGGAPFRTISISGSTGVLPSGGRPRNNQLNTGSLSTIAGGVIENAQSLASAVDTLTSSSSGKGASSPHLFDADPNKQAPGEADIVKRSTGYYQYLQLQKFLESYAEVKKLQVGRNLRLVLVIWKERAAYFVTPQTFRVVKSKESPHEYRYDLQLLAWKRINSDKFGKALERKTSSKSKGLSNVASVLKKLEAAREVLTDARAVVASVKSTIESVSDIYEAAIGGPLRQTALLLKDVAGVVKTAADFPTNIRNQIADDLGTFIGVSGQAVRTIERTNFRKSFKDALDQDEFKKIYEQAKRAADPEAALPGTSASVSSAGQASFSVEARNAPSSSGPHEAFSLTPGFVPTKDDLRTLMTDPAFEWFQRGVKPDSFPKSNATQQAIDAEIEAARSLTSEDFKEMQQKAEEFIAVFADAVGLGSLVFSETIGVRTRIAQKREPTEEDHAALAALCEVSACFGRLAVPDNSQRAPTTIEYVAGIAATGGINMRVPKSKFAAPFPYGGTLERLAAQYLGDATRWHEIAALNDLRAPYVDETGVTVSLVLNGSGNRVAIADASDIVLGQGVYLQSNTKNQERRLVLQKEQVSSSYWLLTLNGDADLHEFTTGDGAELLYFPRYTVRGGQILYIPSDSPPALLSPYAPSAEDLERILESLEIDGALTETGDLLIRPDADWPFVYGISALVQWTRTALSTPQGSSLDDPSFGLAIQVGDSNADASPADILQGLKAVFANNRAFTGIQSAQVSRSGATTNIAFEAGIRGVDALIPISFDLRR